MIYDDTVLDDYGLTVVVPIMQYFVQGHVFSLLWSTSILIYHFLLLVSYCQATGLLLGSCNESISSADIK